MTPDLENLAAGLSEAQRVKLFDLRHGQPSHYVLGLAGFALMRRGLAFVNELGTRHLTDLGHAVCRHIESRTRGEGE